MGEPIVLKGQEMVASEKDLAHQLIQAGNRLLSPPPSVDELLPLLDELEHCLERVEQSPSKRIRDALSPSIKALVANKLLGHLDADVKVSVATCCSEITRITAPDAPYDDDQMKEIFQLIVSSFENLYDKSSPSYKKRASILETVAKVRSCLLMLDLECDLLILQMFQHLLKSVRDYHPEDVFSSMETIMTLVLDESEDISPGLLSSILQYLKRGNKDVQPIAQKLAEKVLTNCATKIKPYLLQAVNSLGISLNDYKEVVANVCQTLHGDIESNNINVGGSNLEAKDTLKETASPSEVSPARDSTMNKLNSDMSNGDLQKEAELPRDLKESRGQEYDVCVEVKAGEESSKDKPNDSELIDKIKSEQKSNRRRGRKGYASRSTLGAAEVTPVEEDTEADHHEKESKDIGCSQHNDTAIDTKVPSNGDKKTDVQQPSPKTSENEAIDVSSISPSGQLPQESRSKNGRGKKKETTIQVSAPEHVGAPKKEDKSTSDLGRIGQRKAVLGKDITKNSSKDEAKECDYIPKSAAKSVNNETEAVGSKRKRTAGREKTEIETETEEYGKNFVGSKIKVWWPDDQMFYEGFVHSFDLVMQRHKIVYTDGDVEVLNLKEEKWEFVKGDVDSKKGNAKGDGSSDALPEMDGGGVSSKKAKVTASKPGHTKRGESAADKNSKDGSLKNTSGAEDEKVVKSEELEDSDLETPLGGTKFNQETPNNSTKSKAKTAKGSTSKSNNGNGKVKAGSSSRGKETNTGKKSSSRSAKSGETGKGKSPNASSKAQKSGARSGKKRQRGS